MIILSNTCKILSWIIFSIIIILIPIIFLLILIILISIFIFINITCKPLQWLPIVSKARSSMQVSAKLIRTKFGNEAKTLKKRNNLIIIPWYLGSKQNICQVDSHQDGEVKTSYYFDTFISCWTSFAYFGFSGIYLKVRHCVMKPQIRVGVLGSTL